MGWPFGLAALVAWMFPGVFIITWAVFILAIRAIFWRGDRRAVVTLMLSGFGFLLYLVCLRF